MIKGVVFDMDGVLVDTEALHFAAIRMALEKYDVKSSREDMLKLAGTNYPAFIGKLVEKSGKSLDVAPIVKDAWDNYYSFTESVQALPGSEKILDLLINKLKITVASGCPKNFVLKILEKADLLNFFNKADIVGIDEVKNPKPAPDVYLLAVTRLGLNPNECVAIEDTSSGMTAAKDAGLYCVVVPTIFSKNQDFSRADLRVESLLDLNYEVLVNIDRK